MNFNFKESKDRKIFIDINNLPEIKVFVTKVQEGDVASKIIGYFTIKEEKIRFKSIAFGRIGGHNVSLSIAKKSIDYLKKLSMDPELVQVIVQRKLIEGDVIFPSMSHLNK